MSLSQQSAVQPAPPPVPLPSTSKPGPLVTVRVALSPQKKQLPNGDIVLLGYVQNAEVEVVFKRDNALIPLLTRLADLVKFARTKCEDAGQSMPHVSELRCGVDVEGSWRVRLQVDDDEIPVRRYQILVNRWRIAPMVVEKLRA